MSRLETAAQLQPQSAGRAKPPLLDDTPLAVFVASYVLPSNFASHHQRQPDLCRARKRLFAQTKTDKISPHHADDHEGSAVQPHCLAQDLRVPAETSLPKPIAYDHDRVPARHAILFQRESATPRRNGAENGEEVVGNKLSIDLPGFL